MIVKHIVNILWYTIELHPIEEELLCNPWEFQNTHGKLLELNYVADLQKNGTYYCIAAFIMVYHLTNIAHFVPCHKEVITAEKSTILLISNCYKLHGVPKIIVSDRYPRFVAKFWQSCMGRLNTKLNMSTARHPRADGLTERVNQTMQTLLPCYYCVESTFDWTSHLSMVEFCLNFSINEASTHSPFEVMYGNEMK